MGRGLAATLANAVAPSTQAERLKKAARESFALTGATDTLALEIRFLVERLNLLIEQIAQLDKRFAQFRPKEQQLLQSIPGLGNVWASTIPAAESGESKGKGKMSKRGSKYLRGAVMQAAEVAVFLAKDPLFTAVYDRQKARGKSHTVALSHVAHKMLHVVFSVLKNRRPYTPILN